MSDRPAPPPDPWDRPPPPPHSREAEQGVLGSVLINADLFPSLRDELDEADFYLVRHALVWRALGRLADAKKDFDVITVADELQAAGQLDEIGGLDYLLRLLADTPTSLHAESYATIVREHAARRAILRVTGQVAGYVFDGHSVVEISEHVRTEFERIGGAGGGNPIVEAEPLAAALSEALRAGRREEALVATGLADLDKMLQGGLWPGRLYIVAGRPGSGKSALLLGMAAHAAEAGRRVGLFSLEMPNEEQAERLLSQLSGLPHRRLALRGLTAEDWPALSLALERMGNMPIYFDDTPSPTIPELRAKCRRMAEQGLDLLVVDSLNLLNPKMETASVHERINWLAYQLKILARELDVPVLAAHHMSRRIEQGGERQPELSDLEQAGEKPADVVAFLYGERKLEAKGGRRLKLAKHRSGPTGVVRLTFLAETMRFVDAATHRDEERERSDGLPVETP